MSGIRATSTSWRLVVMAALLAALGGSAACKVGSECKPGASDMGGLCMPICPEVKCGDKVCMRYLWADGLWNKDLRCEDIKNCPADCSNVDYNLSQSLYLILISMDAKVFNVAPYTGRTETVSCTGGGEVLVVGSDYCMDIMGGKICTRDVTYTFTNCAWDTGYNDARLVFASGSLHAGWTYMDTGSNNVIATTTIGTVTLSGTIRAGPTLDMSTETLAKGSCAVDYTNISGSTPVVTGSMCGRPIVTPIYMP